MPRVAKRAHGEKKGGTAVASKKMSSKSRATYKVFQAKIALAQIPWAAHKTSKARRESVENMLNSILSKKKMGRRNRKLFKQFELHPELRVELVKTFSSRIGGANLLISKNHIWAASERSATITEFMERLENLCEGAERTKHLGIRA